MTKNMPPKNNCGVCHKKKSRCSCKQSQDYKWSDTMIEDIEKLLKLDMPVKKACAAVGIDDATYYRHVAEDPALEERFRVAKRFARELARKSVIFAIPKNPKLALAYLKYKERDEFAERFVHDDNTPKKDLSKAAKERLRRYNPDALNGNEDTDI